MSGSSAVRDIRALAYLAVFAVAPLVAGQARAQAWGQRPGGLYVKTSASFLHTEDEFDFRGARQDIFAEDLTRSDTSFHQVSITQYLEYGLSSRFTLVASVAFKIAATRETLVPIVGAKSLRITRRNTDLADGALFLRTSLLTRPVAVAIQGGVKFPLGYEQSPVNDGPPVGTDEVDGEINVTIGRSLYPLPAYVSGGAGYRLRGGDLHDEVLYDAEAGYNAGRLFLKIRFDALKNTHAPPDIAGATIVTPFPGGVLNQVIVGDQDIYKLSSETNVTLGGPWSLSAEVFHMLSGKDTVAGTAYSLAVVYAR